MRPGRPNGFGAETRGAVARPTSMGATRVVRAAMQALAGLALVAEMAAGPAWASETDPLDTARPARHAPPGGTISISFLTGSTQFDTGLADYQWDVTPRFGWGVLGLVGRGRLAAGLELWRAGTTQAVGDLGSAPEVHATSAELVGEVMAVERWETRLWLRGHGGLMRLGYHPDQITIQPPGPVSPIVVALDPVNAWTGGAGVALRRALTDRWALGLGVDMRRFTIDTAHRAGNEVVYGRETFGDWTARCEVARVFGRR
jgi:hypothetical protein